MSKNDYTYGESVENAIYGKGKGFTRNKAESVKKTADEKLVRNANLDGIDARKLTTSKIKLLDEAVFSEQQKLVFLDELSQHGVVKYACREAGISKLTFLYNYQTDKEFRRLVDDAFLLGAINLEDEAKIRAVRGVDEPVYFRGELVGTITKFSDFLMAFLLKGNFPYKYGLARDENIESDVLGQPRLKVASAVKNSDALKINYSAMTDEQLKEIIASETPDDED